MPEQSSALLIEARLRSSTSEREQLTLWEQEAGEPVLLALRCKDPDACPSVLVDKQ